MTQQLLDMRWVIKSSSAWRKEEEYYLQLWSTEQITEKINLFLVQIVHIAFATYAVWFTARGLHLRSKSSPFPEGKAEFQRGWEIYPRSSSH